MTTVTRTQAAGTIEQLEATTNKGNPLYRHQDTDGAGQYVTTYPSTTRSGYDRSGRELVQVVLAMRDGLQLGVMVHGHPRCPGQSLEECGEHALTEWLTVKELHRAGNSYGLVTGSWKIHPAQHPDHRPAR